VLNVLQNGADKEREEKGKEGLARGGTKGEKKRNSDNKIIAPGDYNRSP
jgi:hypothetical protein